MNSYNVRGMSSFVGSGFGRLIDALFAIVGWGLVLQVIPLLLTLWLTRRYAAQWAGAPSMTAGDGYRAATSEASGGGVPAVVRNSAYAHFLFGQMVLPGGLATLLALFVCVGVVGIPGTLLAAYNVFVGVLLLKRSESAIKHLRVAGIVTLALNALVLLVMGYFFATTRDSYDGKELAVFTSLYALASMAHGAWCLAMSRRVAPLVSSAPPVSDQPPLMAPVA